MEISDGCEEFPDVNFLCGHTLSELINTERKATEYALTTAKRPNYTITIPEVNAFTIGELLYMFELETAYCGAMLNIDTFNQPGVEGGKNAVLAETIQCAAVVFSTVPILIVYPFLQKYFVQGVMIGAVKE